MKFCKWTPSPRCKVHVTVTDHKAATYNCQRYGTTFCLQLHWKTMIWSGIKCLALRRGFVSMK